MEDLPAELLSFIFDFTPESSLELRKVCDDWNFVITKFYNSKCINNIGTFKEIIDVFYRSKLKVKGVIFIGYNRHIDYLELCDVLLELEVLRLRNIHTLILNNVLMYDVSALSNAHTLNINLLFNVKNISSLGNVRTLRLNNTQLVDASLLGNVHSLDLSFSRVKDVSGLENVHALDISYTRVKNVSNLSNVHTLDLAATKVEDVSTLGKLHTLDISCTRVKDVSFLYNLHTLKLYGVNADIYGLGNVNIFR